MGDITVVDGFISVFAPEMPLYGGEFCSPDDVLDSRLRMLAQDAVSAAGAVSRCGGYAMVRGPFFEGRKYDKAFIASSGASTVGMSTLPEACVAALFPQVKVVALNFITNTAFEHHSHQTNQDRAKEQSKNMGRVLTNLVRLIRAHSSAAIVEDPTELVDNRDLTDEEAANMLGGRRPV